MATGAMFKTWWRTGVLSDVAVVLQAPDQHVDAPMEPDPDAPPPPAISSSSIPAHAVLLAAASEYFRTRLLTEVGGGVTVEQEGGARQLVVQLDDEEHVRAAEALLEVIYTEEVPAAGPARWARMCNLADRWQAPACLERTFSALANLKEPQFSPAAAVAALQLLPECVQRHAAYSKWLALCFGVLQKGVEAGADVSTLLLALFGDVHAVLTTPAALQLFTKLPWAQLLAWAGSDGLVVDSENSVVVALDCYVRAQSLTREQLLQLSSLVRVKRLTPSYRLRLQNLAWWHHDKQATLEFSMMAGHDISNLQKCNFPAAWSAAPRRQLDARTLQQRTAIVCDVLRGDLEAALRSHAATILKSPAVYVAGHGVQLSVDVAAAGAAAPAGTQRSIGVFIYNCTFTSGSAVVVDQVVSPLVLGSFSISAVMATGASKVLTSGSKLEMVRNGWGTLAAFAASTIADLEPHLVDGRLKLRAEFEALR